MPYIITNADGPGSSPGMRPYTVGVDVVGANEFVIQTLPEPFEDYVIDDDGVSLRLKTQTDLDNEAEVEATAAIDRKDLKALAMATIAELQALGSTTTPAEFRDAIKAIYKTL